MAQKNLVINYREYNSANDLAETDKMLLNEAIKAIDGSYAPYSNFNVGAAVLMQDGNVVTGSNQENAASPSGLCAERVAIFAAHHKFPTTPIEAIAIAAKTEGKLTGTLVYPCAACIQVMVESQMRSGKPIRIIVGSATKVQIIDSVDDLVPFSFSNLNK